MMDQAQDIAWDPEMMVEVTLHQPDDFLKVRETLTRIGVRLLVKRRNYFSPVIFFIRRESITSYTSRSCSRWMANTPT